MREVTRTDRDRQRPTVQGVHPVGGDEARQPAGTTDPGHHDGVGGVQVEFREGAIQGCKHAEVAATRTPDRLQVTLVVARLALCGSGSHRTASVIISWISLAVNGRPSHFAWLSTVIPTSPRTSRASWPVKLISGTMTRDALAVN